MDDFQKLIQAKHLLEKQHDIIQALRKRIVQQGEDIEDLKRRIHDFIDMDDEQVRGIKRDAYIDKLVKGRDECMNKYRKLENQYANVIRKSR